MSFNSYVRPRSLLAGGAALVAGAAIWLALPDGNAGAAGTQAAATTTTAPATSTAGTSTTAPTTTAAAAPAAGSSETNLYPFGAPTGNGDFQVPPPPQDPTLVPTIGTKTTQRLYGADPFQEAVSVTQHVWPAAVPENAPTENNNDPDRPWGLTLLTPDDPLTAITAVPLLHFPNDAPILYVTKTGIPQVTLNEIKRLGDTGISRYNNVDAFLVGAASNPAVQNQLKAIGIKYVDVTAPSVPDLANKVDQLYGSIENPDTGVPNMGNGAENVMVGSMDGTDYRYLLPATHWVAHMASGLQWVTKNSVPQATIDALKRRNGQARIYLFGGPEQISGTVAKQLAQYGTVIRVTNNDIVAFNANPVDTPVDTAVAFAKMWDPGGQVGWKITGPGHGFTLVNINDWQAAVASAPLSHLGFHAPLLFTDGPTQLPTAVDSYLSSVAPTYLTTPADGPYNMTYVIGSWSQIGWPQQAHVDYISEMGNRRLWNQNSGSTYGSSAPTP
ncbi:MAG: cell wall-binding repeat-containing protein [Actinomycetia bacterium]|nr:cell wall-binding repeat-containing protein [Actinomycetes bacterium]